MLFPPCLLFKIIPACPPPQLYLPEELFILQDSAQMPHHLLWLNLLPKNFLFCTRLAPIDFLVVILVTFHYSGSSISPLASHLLNSSDMFMLYCVSPIVTQFLVPLNNALQMLRRWLKQHQWRHCLSGRHYLSLRRDLTKYYSSVSLPTVKFWIKNKSPEIALQWL